MLVRNMRRRGTSRTNPRSLLAPVVGCALLVAGAFSGAGCTHARRAQETAPPSSWLSSDLLLTTTGQADEELRRLRQLESQQTAAGEIARLGRLYDLFDCARFTRSALVRDLFWEALGGAPPSGRRGRAATAAALEIMLERAWSIEAQHPDLSEAQRLFLADFVALVSVDMFGPENEEALEIQSDAFRRVASSGAPSLRDNAQWRIYDHVRAVVRGVNAAPVERRRAIGVHTLYVTELGPERWTTPTRDHERPPWPAAAALLAPLVRATEALRESPAWGASVAAVERADRSALEAFVRAYPRPRDPSLPLPVVPVGTGRPDDDSPLLWVSDDALWFEAAGEQARPYLPRQDDETLVSTLSAELAKDGRGILLVGSEEKSPSSGLFTALGLATRSGASTIRFAVREPLSDASRHVLTAFPVRVLDPTAVTPGTAAFHESAIELRLGGDGLRVVVDGAEVAEGLAPGAGYPDTLSVLRRAFPRTEAVRLRLAPDVMYLQVVDLLRALLGGASPRYRGVGLIPSTFADATPTTATSDPRAARKMRAAWGAVRARAARGLTAPSAIAQPYPLREVDQQRIAVLGASLSTCLPDLHALPRAALSVTVVFDEGHVQQLDSTGDSRALKPAGEFQRCVKDRTMAARLRAHRERVSVTFTWSRADFIRDR